MALGGREAGIAISRVVFVSTITNVSSQEKVIFCGLRLKTGSWDYEQDRDALRCLHRQWVMGI